MLIFFNNNLKYEEILSFCEKKMYELDVKDKKILFYLLENSRQSLNSIGKKVGISNVIFLELLIFDLVNLPDSALKIFC